MIVFDIFNYIFSSISPLFPFSFLYPQFFSFLKGQHWDYYIIAVIFSHSLFPCFCLKEQVSYYFFHFGLINQIRKVNYHSKITREWRGGILMHKLFSNQSCFHMGMRKAAGCPTEACKVRICICMPDFCTTHYWTHTSPLPSSLLCWHWCQPINLAILSLSSLFMAECLIKPCKG